VEPSLTHLLFRTIHKRQADSEIFYIQGMSRYLICSTSSRKDRRPKLHQSRMKNTLRMCKRPFPCNMDEVLTLQRFGESAYNYGIDYDIYIPKAGMMYQSQAAMLYWGNNTNVLDFVFSDSPTGKYLGTYSAYTTRRVNVTYLCDAWRVTAIGTGTSATIAVDGIGNMTLSQTVMNSTTYWTSKNHQCESGPRCSVVEAFEYFVDEPWY
jgi:hypothetical protein